MDTRDEPMECEGTSELFASLLGNVSSEQWESFKEQQSELGMYLVDDMSDELSEFSESGDEECVTKVRKKMSHLPKELEDLMGAANINFAKGNVKDAIKMCMELIRSAPTAQELFELLGMIYEEMGESRKSLQVHHGNNDFVNAIRVLESAKP